MNDVIFYLNKSMLLIICVFSTFIINAQQNKIDSLINLISKTNIDTAKIDLYEKLGDTYRNEKKMDSCILSFKRALEINKKNNYSLLHQCWNSAALDYILYEMGNYTESLQYAEQHLTTAKQLNDTGQQGAAHLAFGHDYRELGDYQQSLNHYFMAYHFWDIMHSGRHDPPDNTFTILCVALTYLKMGNPDSALFYTNQRFKFPTATSVGSYVLLSERILGDVYSKKGDDETALKYYRQYVPDYVKYKERNRDLGFVLNSMAGIFLKRNQIDSADLYAQKALENAQKFQDQQNIYDAARLLYVINDSLRKENYSFKYLKVATAAKDSMLSIEKLKQIQILSFNEQVREKEQKEADAKEAAKDQMIIIIASILVAIASSLIWYRIRQLRLKYKTILEQKEAEKLKVRYEKQLLELEAKALRAQMNPHFIFNCMNSIKALVQKKEEDKAVNYLTTFSKLIRTIFQNSDKREITLFDEMETCKLYTQLESMRFGNKFTYHFNIDESIDLKSIPVPALIIQPFIENSIWHGIMPKEDEGTLTISIFKNSHAIHCEIEDDGIGREMSKQNKFKEQQSMHQSKGVHLTQSRLDLNNLLNQKNATIEIIDKRDEQGNAIGTKIVLTFIEF